MNKILFSSIREANQKIISGTIRPTEICKSALKVTSMTKSLNAYVNVTEKLAELQSQEADKRQESSSVLNGIPIAMKDNFCIQGERTTCASKMLENFVPGYDATVYERLRDAGAVLVGKTNLDEFAMGCGTVDSIFGPTKNLWGSELIRKYTSESDDDSVLHVKQEFKDPQDFFITGGSSGGSAVAVATGSCYAAIGSDTGGSTRNPASYCGVIGFKPSYGVVSRHGLIPLVNSMDVPGILARNVDDVIVVFNTIAGPDQQDSTTLKREFEPIELPDVPDFTGLRVGIPQEYILPELDAEVETCWEQVTSNLAETGAQIVPVSLPHTRYSIACYMVLSQCEIASNMARYDGIEFGFRPEKGASMEELFVDCRNRGFNDIVKSRILSGNYFLLSENYSNYFERAMRIRRLIADDFTRLWDASIDVLVTPTTLSDAPLFSEYSKFDNQTQCLVQDYFTQPVNLAGLPAISVPVKVSKRGLPISLQLIAPYLEDERLLTVAKWLEETVPFPKLVLRDSIANE